MAAAAGAIFFLSVLAFAGWTIVATVRPRLGRIGFLLEYGPAIGAALPPQPRVTSRGRSLPIRMAARSPLRAAA